MRDTALMVVFNCTAGGPPYPWADPDVELGIGGSEESVILLARELAALGHRVTVHNHCGGKSGVYHGVRYVDAASPVGPSDVVVAWRYWHLLRGAEATHKWVWCHDVPVGGHCPAVTDIVEGALSVIGKFVVLNNYHAGLYRAAGIPDDKILVSHIGVDQEPYVSFADGILRDNARVMYFSQPSRGLHRLREIWPAVKDAVPTATLASFWWEDRDHLPADGDLGILPMMQLGYRDIACETLRSGVFAYPSVFHEEISPATTIKAQYGGAIPVVVKTGGMIDTVRFGFSGTQEEYPELLISTLRKSINGELEDTRTAMMEWARQEYSWKRTAAQWSAVWSGGSR